MLLLNSIQVTESISGSVVPLAMFLFFVEFSSSTSHYDPPLHWKPQNRFDLKLPPVSCVLYAIWKHPSQLIHVSHQHCFGHLICFLLTDQPLDKCQGKFEAGARTSAGDQDAVLLHLGLAVLVLRLQLGLEGRVGGDALPLEDSVSEKCSGSSTDCCHKSVLLFLCRQQLPHFSTGSERCSPRPTPWQDHHVPVLPQGLRQPQVGVDAHLARADNRSRACKPCQHHLDTTSPEHIHHNHRLHLLRALGQQHQSVGRHPSLSCRSESSNKS